MDENNINYINKSFDTFIDECQRDQIKFDIVFASPPWNGPDYTNDAVNLNMFVNINNKSKDSNKESVSNDKNKQKLFDLNAMVYS